MADENPAAEWTSDDEDGAPSAERKIYGFKPRAVQPYHGGPRTDIYKNVRRPNHQDDVSTDEEIENKKKKQKLTDEGLLDVTEDGKGVFLAHSPDRFIHVPQKTRSDAAVSRLVALQAAESLDDTLDTSSSRSSSSSSSEAADGEGLPKLRWFSGEELFCNRLEGEDPNPLAPRSYVGLEEIVGGKNTTRWNALFITAMAVDPKYISRFFPLAYPTQTTIVSHVRVAPKPVMTAYHSFEPTRKVTPDNPLVLKGEMSNREGELVKVRGPNGEESDFVWISFSPKGFGSIHGKVILLRNETVLRVVITSSNMTAEWSFAREAVWVQDFPILAPDAIADAEHLVKHPNLPHVFASSPVGRDFAHQLISYLAHLRVPVVRMSALLERADFSKARVALVCSVPLRSRDPLVQATFGHMRIRSLLSQYGWPTPGKEAINVITGSMGNLKPYFLRTLATSFTGDCRHPLPRSPTNHFTSFYSPFYKDSSKEKMASTFPYFKILFPDEPRVMISSMIYPDSVNMHKSFYHNPAFPRELFYDGVANPSFGAGFEVREDRRRIKEPLAHAKVIFRAADLPLHVKDVRDGQLAGWIYAGSHNLSENAWGVFPSDKNGEWTWPPRDHQPASYKRAVQSPVNNGNASNNNGSSSSSSGGATALATRRERPRSYNTNSYEIGVLMLTPSRKQFASWQNASPLIDGDPYHFKTVPYTYGSTLQGGHATARGIAAFMESRRKWLAKRGLSQYFPENVDRRGRLIGEEGEEQELLDDEIKRKFEQDEIELAIAAACREPENVHMEDFEAGWDIDEYDGIGSDDEEREMQAGLEEVVGEPSAVAAFAGSSRKRTRGEEDEEAQLQAALIASIMDN